MSGTAPGEPGGPVAVGKSPDSEIRQFPCKQCGANLTFQPGTTHLVCPYCGHQEEVPVSAEAIREYDLNDALLNRPATRGWGTETRSVRCVNCGATTTFSAEQVAGVCAFCGSGQVVQEPGREDLIRPESVLPFKVDRKQAVQRFRDWLGHLWFRPNALKQSGELAKIAGAYLPFWTFDAFTSSWWTAEAGYYYYETETYQEQDEQGNWVTKERQVQRTRWQPASGYHEQFFDDELVCASKGLPQNLLNGVTPYQLEELTAYNPGFLSGFMAEEYRVDLPEGWEKAKQSMEGQLYSACASEVPGDTHRNLNVDTAFSQQTFKHILLPVWIAAYLYQNKTYRFIVNGQTGRVSGEAPISWWKVAGAVLLAVLIALIIWYFTRR
jgi:DNA-directed RNA polymerase subunit RPC12/RpoP